MLKDKIDLISYKEALELVIDIHIERKNKYGNSWQNNKEYQFMGLIKEKSDRLEFNFLNNSNTYENKKDCLIDLINWSLFYLQTLIK